MMPKSIVNLEELRQHDPRSAPGTLVQSRNLAQHDVIILQYAAPPQMEQQ
jgi:hypothetical protein